MFNLSLLLRCVKRLAGVINCVQSRQKRGTTCGDIALAHKGRKPRKPFGRFGQAVRLRVMDHLQTMLDLAMRDVMRGQAFCDFWINP